MTSEDLDRYIPNYTDFNDWLIRQRYELLKRYFHGTSCLEFGPATGEGTAYLLEHFPTVVAVDGSQQAVDNLTKRFPGDRLTAVCAYFEEVGLDEIVSFTTVENIRSRHVMERIGMTRDPAEDFEHPNVAEGSPLRPHVLYRIQAARETV